MTDAQFRKLMQQASTLAETFERKQTSSAVGQPSFAAENRARDESAVVQAILDSPTAGRVLARAPAGRFAAGACLFLLGVCFGGWACLKAAFESNSPAKQRTSR